MVRVRKQEKTDVAPSMRDEPLHLRILAYVTSSPGATYQELATNFQVSSSHVRKLVQGLHFNGLVKTKTVKGRSEVHAKHPAVYRNMDHDPNVIHAADLFCGAGGFSQGLAQALEAMGRNLDQHVDLVGINHSEEAIISWKLNHPFGREVREDITKAQPRKLFPGGHLGVLLASPSCTHHSVARGGKPVSDQMRSHPWMLVRWARDLEIDKLICENVPELVNWGPTHVVDCKCIAKKGAIDAKCKTCKGAGRVEVPIEAKKGTIFRQWIREIKLLGYTVDWKIINAADYGDATSRRRFFLMAVKGAGPVPWPRQTHSKVNPKTGKPSVPGTKAWRAAREIINFDLPSQSIFDRKKALAPKTLKRMFDGLQKRNGAWIRPFLSMLREQQLANAPAPVPVCRDFVRTECEYGEMEDYCKTCEVDESKHPKPLAPGEIDPFLVKLRGTGTTSDVAQPAPAATAGGTHLGLCETTVQPIVLGQQSGAIARGVDAEPLNTVATGGAIGLAEGVVMRSGGPSVEPVGLDSPLPAHLTREHQALAEPVLMHVTHGGRDHDVNDPLKTVTTANRGELALAEASASSVEGFVMASGGPTSQMQPRSMQKPLPTVIGNTRLGIVEGIIMPPDGPGGNGEYNHATSLDAPLNTVRAGRGGGHLAEPVLMQYNGTSEAQPVADPLPTQPTHDRFGVAEAEAVLIDMLGSKDDYACRSKSLDGPLMTNHAGGVRTGLAEANLESVIVTTDRPLTNRSLAHGVDQPLPAVVANNERIGVAQPVPEPVIVPNFGEREGQQPRSHSIQDPLPAPTGHGAGMLTEAILDNGPHQTSWVNGRPCVNGWILDIRFRMLQPRELAASMGFPKDFNFSPTKREAIKQIGNAVAVGTAQALISELLAPKSLSLSSFQTLPEPAPIEA
jgi:DNA (cytosine-5)-methyltransferase 1